MCFDSNPIMPKVTKLTLLFRTSSIYYANGSALDIAKIEGSRRYKHVMRHVQATDVASVHEEMPEFTYLSKAVTRSSFLSRMQHSLPLPSFLHKALSRWQYQPLDITALEGMLLALKVATESYLGGPVTIADLAAPMPLSPLGQQILRSASSLAGLDRAVGVQIAGQAAARANGIGTYYQYSEEDHCDGGASPQVILTVDYSRAALTAILWIEDDSVFEYRRIRHDVGLGADALYRCQHSEIDEPCYERLAEALRQVVKMPLEDVEGDVPSMIGGLVLLGEKATDWRLRQILQQVLTEQGVSISMKKSEYEESDMIDPTFAAARGVAAASWSNQNEQPAKSDL